MLTAADFLADYDHLWKILDENYFYFPYLEKQGINVESLRLSTRSQLEERITDANGWTTVRTAYDYDGATFVVEAEVDAVQTHNAQSAIKSAWGVDVEVAGDGTLRLR